MDKSIGIVTILLPLLTLPQNFVQILSDLSRGSNAENCKPFS